MKKILAVLLSTLLISGCSGNSDELNTIATNYLQSSLSYDFSEAKKYATGEALEAMNLVESYLGYSKMSAQVKSIEIIDTDVEKGYAKIQAQIIRDVQSEDIAETENRLILVELAEINGSWYVYDSSVLKMGL